MSKVVRSVKNVTKGYSSVQVKVRNGMLGYIFLAFWSCSIYSDRKSALRSLFAVRCSLTFAATSNDPWGPTGTDMAEISSMTFGR